MRTGNSFILSHPAFTFHLSEPPSPSPGYIRSRSPGFSCHFGVFQLSWFQWRGWGVPGERGGAIVQPNLISKYLSGVQFKVTPFLLRDLWVKTPKTKGAKGMAHGCFLHPPFCPVSKGEGDEDRDSSCWCCATLAPALPGFSLFVSWNTQEDSLPFPQSTKNFRFPSSVSHYCWCPGSLNNGCNWACWDYYTLQWDSAHAMGWQATHQARGCYGLHWVLPNL